MDYTVAVGASSFASGSKEPLQYLLSRGIEVTCNPYGRKMSEDETIAFIKDADGLLAGLEPLNARVLGAANKLKAIARIGTGMENVDQHAARALGIKVSNTPEAPTKAVAEMTLAAALAICRQLVVCNADMHQGKWTKALGKSLDGAVVLIIGYGRIGRAVADLFRKFGSTILVCDPLAPDVSISHLDEGLPQADIISLHASGSQQIIGKEHIQKMRSDAIILNAGRGGLIDEDALYDALIADRLGGCWLDVYREEPYAGRLASCPTALLTPHISTYTAKCRLDMELRAVENLVSDLCDG